MSAKQATRIQIDWQLEAGAEIPLNSRLSKDTFDLYPFAFVSGEEYFQQREGE